ASLTTGSNGTATTTFATAAIGTQTISATVTGAGAPVNESAQLEVEASGTTTSITDHSPDPSQRGEPVLVEFNVTAGTGNPAGLVQVTTNEGATCSGSTASGQCELTFTTAGTWTITAAYQGGGSHSASQGTAQHQV